MPARFGARKFAYGETAFDLLSLFQSGAYSGFLYDFATPPTSTFGSGISPAYQDQANTIANADGNPVGLLIDRSQGVVVGPQLFVSPSVGVGWTNNGDGSYTHIPGNTGLLSVVGVLSIGALYKYSITTVTSASSGVLYTGGNGAPFSTTGVYSGFLVCSANTNLAVGPLSAFAGTVSAISVRQVLGNHGLQATAAAKPTLKLTNGIWRQHADGSDDTQQTKFTPGSEIMMIGAMLPGADASGFDCLVGSQDTGPANRCYLGNNDGVIVGGWGAHSLTTIADASAVDIRGSKAVAVLSANASTVILDILNADGSWSPGRYSGAASGTGGTTNGLALFANNAAGTPGSFFKGDGNVQVVNHIWDEGTRRKAAIAFARRTF